MQEHIISIFKIKKSRWINILVIKRYKAVFGIISLVLIMKSCELHVYYLFEIYHYSNHFI